MDLRTFIIAIFGVLLNAGAQLSIKSGTVKLGQLILSDGFFNSVFRILFNPGIFGGLVLYVVSVALWIYVLSKSQVSIAYPLLSIGYVVNLFLAAWLLDEMITLNKIVGIGLIVLGVYVLTKMEPIL